MMMMMVIPQHDTNCHSYNHNSLTILAGHFLTHLSTLSHTHSSIYSLIHLLTHLPGESIELQDGSVDRYLCGKPLSMANSRAVAEMETLLLDLQRGGKYIGADEW